VSSSAAFARPVRRPEHDDPPRHIEIVATRAQRRTRPRVTYALIAVMSLFAIFAAQLVLSIVVSEGAYQIASLQVQQKDLIRAEKSLSEGLGLLGSPQNLAANAASLGMAPNPTPLQLDLASGVVTGAPGSIDRFGCGGGCNLVANELLVGKSLVSPVSSSNPVAATPPVAPSPAVVDSLPAPVTH
jgi:hypothetical protein